jgi:H+/Cl- antiporter ClcA
MYDSRHEVNPRSSLGIVTTVLVAPITVVLGFVWYVTIDQIQHPSPTFPWEAPPSLSRRWVACVVIGALFAIFANALVVLVAGLVRGRAGNLVPWWLAWVILTLFSLGAGGAFLSWTQDGDGKSLLAYLRVLPFVAVGWPAAIWLRRRQSGKS